MAEDKVEGLQEVLANLNARAEAIEGATVAGLYAAGLHLEARAKPLAPVDTGNLRGSGYTRKASEDTVEVGFSAAYAIYVHENLEAHHPVGQAKFLEAPLREDADLMLEIIANTARGAVA